MLMSGHQPSYMPWLGFFDKIRRADVFILYDTAQYERGGYGNRNRIKLSGGATWIVVPVARSPLATPIADIGIAPADTRWRRNHWTQIQHAYGKAPYFGDYADRVRSVIEMPTSSLLELACATIDLGMELLDIDTPLRRASELGQLDGVKGDHVLSMAGAVGADQVLFGSNGREYVEEEVFRDAGVEVLYQDFRDPPYEQRHGAFLPRLSFLDLVFNCGPASSTVLTEAGVAT